MQSLVNKGVKYSRSKSAKEQQQRIKERNRRAQKVSISVHWVKVMKMLHLVLGKGHENAAFSPDFTLHINPFALHQDFFGFQSLSDK